MPFFDLIALDADDTLWQNETLYRAAETRFAARVGEGLPPASVAARLYETEARNIPIYGFGVKAFALSMLETALELRDGRVSGAEIRAILAEARGMLEAEVELLPNVAEAVPQVAARAPLMVLTKGDLLHQESKIARSGLASHFRHAEVVSTKTPASYARVLARYGVEPARFLMVGNSLKSDIFPVLELGGSAVYIPFHTTWVHEAATPPPPETPGYHQLTHLGELPALLDRLAGE